MAPHDRNATEKVIILALTFRAGLASTEADRFEVEPATAGLDRHLGFDLIIYRTFQGVKQWLLVDATSSRRFLGKKIHRATQRPSAGKKRRGFRFILKGDWSAAVWDVAGIGTDREKCFEASYGRIKDGRPAAFTEACPLHGNACQFARELFRFGTALNRNFANHRRKSGKPGQAAHFSMNNFQPPF